MGLGRGRSCRRGRLMSDRAFKVQQPHMKGEDVRQWQQWLVDQFRQWDIRYPLEVDGDYGVATRSATATMAEAMGLVAPYGMEQGITPELRIKLRNRKLSVAEKARFAARVGYRRKLRDRFSAGGLVHTPIVRITADSWGWAPPVHDGIDLICPVKEPLLAICDGTIVRVQAGGWWGKGAPSDPAKKAIGDGIIVLRCDISAGPFKPGLLFGYGHAEGATVREGQKVEAGRKIGEAGFANAWHSHFMVHGPDSSPPVGGTGDRDPRPFVNYARKNT